MFIGRVIGTVVATKKDDSLVGSKLLIVQPLDPCRHEPSYPLVAVDSVGAGIGEVVLVIQGSSARLAVGKPAGAVDAAIVGIVDTMEIDAAAAAAARRAGP